MDSEDVNKGIINWLCLNQNGDWTGKNPNLIKQVLKRG